MTQITLSRDEIIGKVKDKLEETLFFIDSIEKTKTNRHQFSYNLSAFLSASDSVITLISVYGKKYCQIASDFEAWYKLQEDKFRTPFAVDAKKNKESIGTDSTWVYLRSMRNDTVHIKLGSIAQLAKVVAAENIYISDSLSIEHRDKDGKLLSSEQISSPQQTPKANVTIEVTNDTWLFMELPVFRSSGFYITTLVPPQTIIINGEEQAADVLTVCKAHIMKVQNMITEFEHLT